MPVNALLLKSRNLAIDDKVAMMAGLLGSRPVVKPVFVPNYGPNPESEDMGAPVTPAEALRLHSDAELKDLLEVFTDIVLWMDTGPSLVESIRRMGDGKNDSIAKLLAMTKDRESSFTEERRRRYFW